MRDKYRKEEVKIRGKPSERKKEEKMPAISTGFRPTMLRCLITHYKMVSAGAAGCSHQRWEVFPGEKGEVVLWQQL